MYTSVSNSRIKRNILYKTHIYIYRISLESWFYRLNKQKLIYKNIRLIY